jgi:DNA-binding response OmpR family regulator
MDQIAKKRIMIVRRDSHFLYLLQRFVRTNAYRPIPVNLADDVLSLAKDKKPVAIVLEVDTPEVVGWKALHALKSDPDAGGIPAARTRLEQAERNGTRVKTREYQGQRASIPAPLKRWRVTKPGPVPMLMPLTKVR